MSKNISCLVKRRLQVEELEHLRAELDAMPPGAHRRILDQQLDAKWDSLDREINAEHFQSLENTPRTDSAAKAVYEQYQAKHKDNKAYLAVAKIVGFARGLERELNMANSKIGVRSLVGNE